MKEDNCKPRKFSESSKQAKGKILQRDEFLKTVLESLTHPFYVINANDYTIEVANPATGICRIAGTVTCYALTHKTDKPCDSDEHPCPLEIIKKTKKPVMVEHIHYDKDGNIRNVEVHGFPIFDSKRNVVRMIEYCLDITERKRTEEVLKCNEERYALAQRAANIGSWDWDIQTGELVWSEQIEPMFGFGRGEFGATYEAFLDCVHPEDRQFVIDSVNACVEEGKDYAIEHRIVWPDGAVRWVSERGDITRDEHGKAIRMLGVVQDITERRQAEQQQLLASRILERINQKGEGLNIIREILELVKEFSGFDAVGIRLREGGDFPYFEVNGFSDDFIKAENYLCARNESGEVIYDSQGRAVLECMCGRVIGGGADPSLPFFTKGGSFWTNSTTELLASVPPKDFQVPIRGRCNKAGYESVALIPLRSGEEIVGLLQLNDHRAGRFTSDEISFFEGIGTSIGIALARIRSEEDISNLAKFPSENPFPVLRIAQDGTILYTNEAGLSLLGQWNRQVGESTPEDWRRLIAEVLDANRSEIAELELEGRIFSLVVAPVAEADYVNVYGRDITERKRTEEEIRKLNEELEQRVAERTAELTRANKQLLEEIERRKRLEKEILGISEREQRRIGQELHDSLGQQLTGIAIMSKVLEQKLHNKSLDESTEAKEISRLVNQAVDQTRGLAKGLYPIALDASGLMSSLQELARTTEQLFGVGCSFRCDKPVPVDDTTVAMHLYRIAQEAINNAVKHGRAKNIQIELASGQDKSVLSVRNNGLDLPELPASGRGMGLQIMDYRAKIINGSLDVRRGSDGGAIVTCSFPNEKR